MDGDLTLIEKLEAEAFNPTYDDRMGKWIPLLRAREVIRQHQAEQSQDLVERVTKAIERTRLDESIWPNSDRKFALAAIAAMGEEPATESPEGDAGQFWRNSGQTFPTKPSGYQGDNLFNDLTIKFPQEKLGFLNDIFQFFKPHLQRCEISVVDKLEAVKCNAPSDPMHDGFNVGIDRAIFIIKQHKAIQPNEIRDTVTVRATIANQPHHAGRGVVFKLRYLEYENDELKCSTGPLDVDDCIIATPEPVMVDLEAGAKAYLEALDIYKYTWERLRADGALSPSYDTIRRHIKAAKACAKAWGLKYVN